MNNQNLRDRGLDVVVWVLAAAVEDLSKRFEREIEVWLAGSFKVFGRMLLRVDFGWGGHERLRWLGGVHSIWHIGYVARYFGCGIVYEAFFIQCRVWIVKMG